MAVTSAYQTDTMQRAALTERYAESVVVSIQQYYMNTTQALNRNLRKYHLIKILRKITKLHLNQ